MKAPVRILSDFHLGHPVARILRTEHVRPLVSGAGTVIFNGDTWQELDPPYAEKSRGMLEELREICREEGADTVFLPGNHDPGWSGDGWAELAGGRILVTHGDAMMRAGSPWKREILAAKTRIDELWAAYPTAGHDVRARLDLAKRIARELCTVEQPFGKSLVQRVTDALVPPERAWRILEAWLFQGEAGAEFCERYFPRVEVLIAGHFHHVGCWRKMGRLVINTGSFMNPSRARWVEWHEGWLSYGEIDEAADVCRIGRRLGVWRYEDGLA